MTTSKLAIWSFVLVLIAYFLIIINYIADAIWGFITGNISNILGIAYWLAGLISVVTFILGIVALRRIKKKKLKGKGFAIATIILSSIIIIYFLYFLYAFIWLLYYNPI